MKLSSEDLVAAVKSIASRISYIEAAERKSFQTKQTLQDLKSELYELLVLCRDSKVSVDLAGYLISGELIKQFKDIE